MIIMDCQRSKSLMSKVKRLSTLRPLTFDSPFNHGQETAAKNLPTARCNCETVQV